MIRKAEARRAIMRGTFQLWWLRFCVISFLLHVPVRALSSEVCKETQRSETLIIKCVNHSNTDNRPIINILPDEEIEVTCPTHNNLHCIESIKPIKRTATFKRLVISQCPVPEVSFFKLLKILKIITIKSISFQSSSESQTNFELHTFEKLDRVEILHLKNDNIYTLPELIFNDTTALEELDLSYNRLKTIPEKLFDRLKKLRKLNLQRNEITILDDNVFQYIPTLTSLNLCGNGLSNISTSVFNSLTNLTTLELCNNSITNLEERFFYNLPHLEEINLSNNRLTNLSQNWFNKTKNLKILYLNGNFLEAVPIWIFHHTKGLEKLDLSNNRLKNLTGKSFHCLANLSVLLLNGNQLTDIYWEFFHKMTSLTELNLSNNQLKELDSKTFLDLTRLEMIDLSYNQLTLEEAKLGELSPFITCLNLKYIRLRNNSLKRVFADWRLLFNMLEELDLSYNKLEFLMTEDFIFNASNATIDFSNNPLKIIDLNELEHKVKPPCHPSNFFRRNFSKKPSHHNRFNLENSPIKCNCHALSLAKYFQGRMDKEVNKLVNLSSLGVNCNLPTAVKNISLREVNVTELRCSISELYPDEADNCPEKCDCHYRSADKANIVNCTNTGMTVFPERIPIINDSKIELLFGRNNFETTDGLSALAMKGNVTVISLSHNKLRNFDDVELPNTLEVLKLDHNEISYLKKETIDFLRNAATLTNLTLHGNPWECDCGIRHFQSFVRYHNPSLWIPDRQNIRCKNNNDISVMSRWEELCPTTFVWILLFLTIIGVISIPTIVLYYKFKRKIKQWMFTHKILLWLVTEKEIDKDKLYDAFVSFSHKDQDFVHQHLIPELEENGDHTFKLCVHDRDFVAGEFIPSQIIHSVENSRRTIIILTPNFLQSVWARMEFRMAHLKAIKERCARVIVILLEEVDDELLDPELKAYIAMNTYVKWGDSAFWDKLRYALPHPQIKCSKRNRRIGTDILHEIELRGMQKSDEQVTNKEGEIKGKMK